MRCCTVAEHHAGPSHGWLWWCPGKAAVAPKAEGEMAVGAIGLDATAYPANNQTTTARLVAQNLSDVRMAIFLED